MLVLCITRAETCLTKADCFWCCCWLAFSSANHTLGLARSKVCHPCSLDRHHTTCKNGCRLWPHCVCYQAHRKEVVHMSHTHTHARMHTRTHAHTHAHTHTHTYTCTLYCSQFCHIEQLVCMCTVTHCWRGHLLAVQYTSTCMVDVIATHVRMFVWNMAIYTLWFSSVHFVGQ